MTIHPAARTAGPPVRAVLAGVLACVVAAGLGGLLLWAAILWAAEDPIEGLHIVSVWFLGLLAAGAGVLGAVICLAFSTKVRPSGNARAIAVLSSCAALAVAFPVLGWAISLVFI